MKRIAFVSLVVLSLLLLSTTAQAAQPSKQRILGSAAAADFYSFNPQTCEGTYVYVFGSEVERQSPGSGGASNVTAYLYLDIYTYNECDFTTLLVLSSSTELAPGELQVQAAARTASIRKDLVLYDFLTGTTVPVTIDLTWNAIGEPTRSQLHQTSRSPLSRISSYYSSVSREAEVTGSVLLEDTNVIAQSSSLYTAISHSNNGIITRQ